jgi:hypothetical protein
MLSEELIVQLHKLSQADKVLAMQLLANDLASRIGDVEDSIIPEKTYQVWSPYDSAGAAAILTELLDEYKQAGGE